MDIVREIESARQAAGEDRERSAERDELLRRFEEVASLLQSLDLETAWDEVTEPERRVLVEELVEKVAVFPDHLEVTIAGAPRLNVGLAEVGLSVNQSQNVGVGGGFATISTRKTTRSGAWRSQWAA